MKRQRNVVVQERQPWYISCCASTWAANHPAHQRHAAFCTSMFRAPQWHGATQMHFPPRPRKSAWHCDIANVISPHGLPTLQALISHDTACHPAHQRHAGPTHYKRSYHAILPILRLTWDTPRLHQHASRSPVARRRVNALPTNTSQIRMALRHHERNSPHGLPTYTGSNRISKHCPAPFPVPHSYYKLATSKSFSLGLVR